MRFLLTCSYCREENKPDGVDGGYYYSQEEIEEHFRKHGATEEGIERGRKAWQEAVERWKGLWD